MKALLLLLLLLLSLCIGSLPIYKFMIVSSWTLRSELNSIRVLVEVTDTERGAWYQLGRRIWGG
jgi:hypothetical protein